MQLQWLSAWQGGVLGLFRTLAIEPGVLLVAGVIPAGAVWLALRKSPERAAPARVVTIAFATGILVAIAFFAANRATRGIYRLLDWDRVSGVIALVTCLASVAGAHATAPGSRGVLAAFRGLAVLAFLEVVLAVTTTLSIFVALVAPLY